MSPGRPDQFKAEVGVSYTKGEVNRAGKLLLDLRETVGRLGEVAALEQFDEEQLDRAWEALTWWRGLHARPLSNVAGNLRYHVDKEDGRVGGRIEVAQRLKRQPTVIDKLTRERGQVTQMHDIGGVRALLPSLVHVYAVSRRLRKSWTVIKVRDYIATPKDSGYRALHLIVRRNGSPIEVQLRTIGQDIWANKVEEVGREVVVGLKFGAGGADFHTVFVAMAEAIACFDRGEISPEELRAALKYRPSSMGQRRTQNDEPAEPADIKHFLVTYNIEAGGAEVREFGTDYDGAQQAYAEAEREALDRTDLDVVLLSSDSLQTIKRTHSSYFDTRESFEALLPAGVLRE